MRLIALLTLALATLSAQASNTEIQVMLLGSFHFANPGLDAVNTKVMDVMTAQRQQEVQSLTSSLLSFKPTLIAIEQDEATVREHYAAHRDGVALTRNERQQIGFRLADAPAQPRLVGIDVQGDFPLEAVQTWAQAHGREAELQGLFALFQAASDRLEQQQHHSLGSALRLLNSKDMMATHRTVSGKMLSFGNGAEQPGAELNAAWFRRNALICGRLVQQLKPGDRAIVLYGAAHVPPLQDCLRDVPGIRLVSPLGYLPQR